MNETKGQSLNPILLESAPLRTKIIESMREAIELGVLQPGKRLVEKDLCLQLGVSRTSLREALRELESEGIIAQTSARGLTVIRISRRDAENVYRIRADIEALIVEQYIGAATDHDLEAFGVICSDLVDAYIKGDFTGIIQAKRVFYRHICLVADNAVALELLSRLTLRTAQLRRSSVTRAERQSQSIAEIQHLAETIAARDVAKARAAALRHVEHAATSAIPFVEK
jgi:DNA-binding GntR family transcriptional regulator